MAVGRPASPASPRVPAAESPARLRGTPGKQRSGAGPGTNGLAPRRHGGRRDATVGHYAPRPWPDRMIEVGSVSVLVLVLAVSAACCLGFGFVLQQNAAQKAPLGDFLSPACCSTS